MIETFSDFYIFFQDPLIRDLFKNGHDYFLEAKFDFIEVFENINVLKVYIPVCCIARESSKLA